MKYHMQKLPNESCDRCYETMLEKVHGFSESYINDQLKTNSNSYLNAFEKIK